MVEERYRLVTDRIRQIQLEETTNERFRDYFRMVAGFVGMIEELNHQIENRAYFELELSELQKWNERLYFDILPAQYGQSYANPEYAVEKLGEAYGQILSFLYTELRGSIVYTFERRIEYLDILFELFVEIYNVFEEQEEPELKLLKEIIYWYASDYTDVFLADRIKGQLQQEPFVIQLIQNSDLSDLRYLYWFGEYISANEYGTAKHLNELPQDFIHKMADVYTEGFRVGFLNTGKDIGKKEIVNIRYVLGFERVIKKAMENFAAMGLKTAIYRTSVTVIAKHQNVRNGYCGGIPNKQYDYDHRNDQGLFLDKKYMERKLQVLQSVYEQHKEQARKLAGPAVTEMFGEEPFSPVQNEYAIKLSEKQEELSLLYDSRSGQIVNQYVPGEERSFTIIAYPVPEIGVNYTEIFDEVIRINTLDANIYEQVQQTLIDALDRGEYVHIKGQNGNRTDLQVQLYCLRDEEKETKFENCVADVNIPVGEVFTSPILEGTNGILHVSKVYLREYQYEDLEITFSNGMIADYNCSNFERELDNKQYIRDNILKKHPTLPLGEFAIGTNTTAYAAARKYGIEEKLPILIAEKMGPHFAVGDTCYSWAEDVKVFNPNGKEIVAKENAVSALRKDDVSKAYYQCHTDITIPYDELAAITVVTAQGEEIKLLENGKFVLNGTEILNEPLKNLDK